MSKSIQESRVTITAKYTAWYSLRQVPTIISQHRRNGQITSANDKGILLEAAIVGINLYVCSALVRAIRCNNSTACIISCRNTSQIRRQLKHETSMKSTDRSRVHTPFKMSNIWLREIVTHIDNKSMMWMQATGHNKVVQLFILQVEISTFQIEQLMPCSSVKLPLIRPLLPTLHDTKMKKRQWLATN